MRMRHAAVVAGLILGLSAGKVSAASFTVTYSQTAAGVVAVASGDFALDQLSNDGPNFTNPVVLPNQSLFAFGGDLGTQYNGSFTGPSSFGPGNGTYATTDSSDSFLFNYHRQLIIVPQGYVSGTLNGTQLYSGASISSLGLTPGTYTWTYGGLSEEPLFSRADFVDLLASTITVQVDPGLSPVPLPASAPMFGAALLALGAIGYGVKRKKAAATA